MSDGMIEAYRGTYFQDRLQKPKKKKTKKSIKGEPKKMDTLKIALMSLLTQIIAFLISVVIMCYYPTLQMLIISTTNFFSIVMFVIYYFFIFLKQKERQ
ncbi:hypothetical protein [Candidatus Phytoplasma solani]|uniref:hypothetical protein n=2 Tax=Candidatus Phytoplasma solani TaxID=69896 RepID=UPI0035902D91